MKLLLIRHGATKGNLEKRYVGITDEPLVEQARKDLLCRRKEQQFLLRDFHRIYVSPMLRCLETADILFPDEKKIVVPGLKECNFGLFEYKNYQELNGNKDYQAFIDSEGMCGFPEGEDRTTFQARCINAFCREVTDEENAAIVCHGGTIMALLDQYSSPHRDYYDWQVRNGCGWLADFIRKPEPKICNIVEI